MTTGRQIDSQATERTAIRLESELGDVCWLTGPAGGSLATSLVERVCARWGAGAARIGSLDEARSDQELGYPAAEGDLASLVAEWLAAS